MRDPGMKTTLLRKSSECAAPIPFRDSLAAALSEALSRAVGRLLSTTLTPALRQTKPHSREALLDALSPDAMTLPLLARGTAPIGLMSLSAPLVAALALRLSGANGGEQAGRKLSRVDQSLARMLVQRALESLHSALAAVGAKTEIEGLRAGAPESARHVLQANLPESQYAEFQLTVPLEEGVEEQVVTFYFIYDFCTSLAQLRPRILPQQQGADAQVWEAHMQRVALLSPIDSRCVLDRFDLPTGEIARLKRGDILPLPGLGLNDIVLELPHRSGRLAYARGKLGAFRRSKALKLLAKHNAGGVDAPLILTDQRPGSGD